MKNKLITEKLNAFSLPAYDEIPDVGLYLEQVARYINTSFTEFPEMKVTPSMISNYAKAKLFSRVNKKTYSREQIATVIFITVAKTVLSIDYVGTALSLYREKQYESKNAYEYFRSGLQAALLDLSRSSSAKTPANPTEDQNMLRNLCTTIAHKMYLERCFEELQNSMPADAKHTAKSKE